jgi:hypothetical protein
VGAAGVGCAALVAVALFLFLRKGEPDKRGDPPKKQFDLSFIAADFNAAVIVHPRRILERPLFAKRTEDKAFAKDLDELGLDPRKIEQLIVVIDPYPRPDVPAMPGFIVRSTEHWDETPIVKGIKEGSEKVIFAGKEYLRTKDTSFAKAYDCLCLADDHTLVGGSEPTFKKMLEAKDAHSPLRDRLPNVDLDHDMIAVFVMEQVDRKDRETPTVRQALGEILKGAKENLPPNFEGADKLADQIVAAVLAVDLGGDTLLSLDIEATDDTAAASLHQLAKNGFDLLKVAVPTVKKDISKSLPPDLIQPVSKLIDELVDGLSLEKSGNHVTLALKMPKDLPETVEKLGATVKDFASKPQPKGIPKGGPLPKGGSLPKGGKK